MLNFARKIRFKGASNSICFLKFQCYANEKTLRIYSSSQTSVPIESIAVIISAKPEDFVSVGELFE